MYRNSVAHKLVQVNAAQRSSGSVTNFSINFDSRDLDRITSLTMVKASLPRLFPNIWLINNRINIQHPAGIDNFFTVPVGQYDIVTLTAALNTATAGINVSWVYNSTTHRLTATYGGVGSATLAYASSTIGPYIGLTSDVVLGAPTALASPPQLSGPDEVYIRSQLIANTSCVVAGSQTSIPLVGTISFIDVPYGFVGRFDSHDFNVLHIEYPYQVVMRRIDIQLTDVLGNEIVLPDNCFLDMLLQFSYIPI